MSKIDNKLVFCFKLKNVRIFFFLFSIQILVFVFNIKNKPKPYTIQKCCFNEADKWQHLFHLLLTVLLFSKKCYLFKLQFDRFHKFFGNKFRSFLSQLETFGYSFHSEFDHNRISVAINYFCIVRITVLDGILRFDMLLGLVNHQPTECCYTLQKLRGFQNFYLPIFNFHQRIISLV